MGALGGEQRAGRVDQQTTVANLLSTLREQSPLERDGLGEVEAIQSPPERGLSAQAAGS